MSEKFSCRNVLRRARDNIKRKLHQNRKFLFVLKVVGDGGRGFTLSRDARRPESVEMPPTDTGEQNAAASAEENLAGAPPFASGTLPAKESPLITPPAMEKHPEEPHPGAGLVKETPTEVSPTGGRPAQETLAEPPHSDKSHAVKDSPEKNPCVNKFLTNDPLADKLLREQSFKEKALTDESGPEGSLARERRTGTPNMEPKPSENPIEGLPSEESLPDQPILKESVPEESVPEESIPEEPVPDESVLDESVLDESVLDESVSEESVPNISAPEESIPEESVPEESVREESVPEESFTEHIEYADQSLDASSSAESSITVSGNSIPASIPIPIPIPIPTMTILPHHPLATPENNRLLRLPLELRLLIYDELLALPRTVSLLYPQRERHPLASIRRVDKQLFSRRAVQRYKFSAPLIGYYDPDTTTFAARFADDEVCTHRQWGSEHLGAITNFAAARQGQWSGLRRSCNLAHHSLNPQVPQQQQQQQQNQAQAQQNPNQNHQAPNPHQPQQARTNANANTNTNAPKTYMTAILCGICSPHAKRSNHLTWQRIHRELIQSHYADPFVPPSFFSSTSAERPLIRVLELRFPRICSAINVLKSLMLGRVAGWRELRRLSVLRIRVCGAGTGAGAAAGGGSFVEGAMGPLNEVDMVVLYSLAVTLSEEMARKVALRSGPRIEIAW